MDEDGERGSSVGSERVRVRVRVHRHRSGAGGVEPAQTGPEGEGHKGESREDNAGREIESRKWRRLEQQENEDICRGCEGSAGKTDV